MCQRGCRARDAPAGLPLLARACAPRGQDTSGSAACDRFGAVLPCHEVNVLFAHRRSFCGSHPQDHSVEQGIHGAVKRTEGCCSSSRAEAERTRDLLLRRQCPLPGRRGAAGVGTLLRRVRPRAAFPGTVLAFPCSSARPCTAQGALVPRPDPCHRPDQPAQP